MTEPELPLECERARESENVACLVRVCAYIRFLCTDLSCERRIGTVYLYVVLSLIQFRTGNSLVIMGVLALIRDHNHFVSYGKTLGLIT